MRSRGVAKLSISIPKELARSLRRRVGSRGVSGFAARAIRHELERAQLGDYLAELEAELGPISDELLREARAAWPKP
jgi:hypothetical protein